MALPLVVQALLAQGLSLLGNAVMAKGRDVIEEKLGVDLEAALETDEGKYNLLQLQNEHQEYLIEASLTRDRMGLEDVQNSREMNARIQEAENASFLAKNTGYLLDFTTLIGTLILAYMIFFIGIPQENKEIAFTAFGSLVAMCVTVVNWHRGSSSGSAKKAEELTQIRMKK